jgi:hypothetical protein
MKKSSELYAAIVDMRKKQKAYFDFTDDHTTAKFRLLVAARDADRIVDGELATRGDLWKGSQSSTGWSGFFHAAATMRQKQLAWVAADQYSDKKRQLLVAAKEAEAVVDAAIADHEKRAAESREPGLFGGTK